MNLKTIRLVPLLLGLASVIPVTYAQVKTVTVLRELDTDRYDPQRTTARGATEVLHMAGDTLVGLDYDLKTPISGIAKHWEVSDDGLIYTFTLHDNVTFCSGKKLTAQDVVNSYKRWLDPANNGLERWRAGPVDDISAPDAKTVVYRLKRPYRDLLRQMAMHGHTIINTEQVEALGNDFGVKGFDGTGPYCFESWTPRNQVVLTRHQGYDWGPPIYADPKPKVDRIVWKIVPEETTRLTALQTSQAEFTRYLPYYSISLLQSSQSVSLSKADSFNWTFFLGFKVDKAVVSDERVRQAINLAVDRDTLTEVITFGTGKPATSMLNTDTPTPGENFFHFNPKRAEQLLDQAGWIKGADGIRSKDGVRLSVLHYGMSGYWKDILEAMQGDLRKVGVDLKVQLFDSTVVWGKLATQEFDSFSMSTGYVSVGDALNQYFLSSSVPTPNRMNWKDPQTDAWLGDADAELDATRADALYSQVLGKLSEGAVWVPLFHDALYLASSKKVKPVRAHGIEGAALYKGLDIEWR